MEYLQESFEVRVIVSFRAPISFVVSLYKQCCQNPQLPKVPCYGRDLSLEEMLCDEWFIKHLDYVGFIEECEQIFGPNSVSAFQYEASDTITLFLKLLGIAAAPRTITRENRSLGTAGIDLLRVLNRYTLPPIKKGEAVAIIRKVDSILNVLSPPFVVSDFVRAKVAKYSHPSQAYLEARFGIRWQQV